MAASRRDRRSSNGTLVLPANVMNPINPVTGRRLSVTASSTVSAAAFASLLANPPTYSRIAQGIEGWLKKKGTYLFFSFTFFDMKD